MQNKPNFQDTQMNVNIYDTKDYKNFIPLAGQKNKPNSNPIKPNLKKAKINVNLYVIEDYENETAFGLEQNKPNQTQFQNTTPNGTRRKKGLWEAAEKAILFFSCRKTGQSRTI